MYSKVYSAGLTGLEAQKILVEADVSGGLPSFQMVGLLASAVKEARERVRISLQNSGVVFPPKRITVNLSPADIRKDGSGFDLPIAISLKLRRALAPPDHNSSDRRIRHDSYFIHRTDGFCGRTFSGWENPWDPWGAAHSNRSTGVRFFFCDASGGKCGRSLVCRGDSGDRSPYIKGGDRIFTRRDCDSAGKGRLGENERKNAASGS